MQFTTYAKDRTVTSPIVHHVCWGEKITNSTEQNRISSTSLFQLHVSLQNIVALIFIHCKANTFNTNIF